jgi:tape measure domain-containing protein
MASIDERVVVMSFENAKFEASVSVTMATLAKLNASIANTGKVNALGDIEKAAQKVTLQGPMSALDKLRQRLFGASQGAEQGFSEIERAGSKVSLLNPITAIDKVRSHLSTVGVGAADGFSDIERASARVTLAPLHHAIDSVQSHFSALTVIATSALNTIVMDATRQGGQLVKSLSLGPVTGGLEEYATNLNSIQTILANTQFEGAKLGDVNKALQELNAYSDQTIYNFSQMARNIGTFTAAGVQLEPAVASIKGIANLAALSGSSAEQASGAMYQLSQAISSGRVSLQDWNSVVNAGMGGATFQRALVTTAKNMGTVADGAVKIDKATGKATINGQSFRESITARPGEKSWLTSDVLTKTLEQFTGDLTEAELAAQGFNEAEIKAILQTAETAKKAATEVKTLKGVIDVAKESIQSGWAKTFEIIFGNFEEAKKTFTDLSTAIQDVIGNAADARNKVLEGWKELGGREELIKGIKATFEALMSVLRPVGEAFRDIFPRKSAEDLFELTVRFREFMEELKIGPETAENLKRTFRGLFALLSIGKTVIFEVVGVIADLLGVVGDGSGGFLAFTGSIGDFLVALDTAISRGEGLSGVFDGLSASLETPLRLLQGVADALTSLFSGGSEQRASSIRETAIAFDELTGMLEPLRRVLKAVVDIWDKFLNITADVADTLAPILTEIADIFSHIGDAIMEGLENVSYDEIMTFIQTTFLGGLAVGIKKLLGGIGIDLTGGGLESLKESLGVLGNTMKSIQRNVNAQTMLLIAAAMVALAGAAALFAALDPKKLAKAMTAITIGIAQLSGAMIILAKMSKGGAFLTLPLIAAGMIGLASALVIMAGAVHLFARLDWEELGRGLAGVAGSLIAIGAALKLMGPSIIVIGPGLIPVALALNLIAVAMKMFGSMKWEEMAKGLLAITGALVAIGVAAKAMGPGLLVTGPGLILVSAGLILLSGAISSFGNMDLGTIIKGIVGISAALVTLGVAILAIPPTIALQAAGLVILGIALTGIAAAIAAMGNLAFGTIFKGLTTIGAALAIFAVGLTAMAGTLPGSAALLAAATAFAILTPTLVILGNLEWSTILKGLGAMAATLGVLAVVGALAAGPLTALGVAMIALSGAVLVAGAGLYLMAKGFSLLGEEGVKGVSVLIAAITAFIALIPKMVIDFIKGLVDILAAIVPLAPKIADSLVKIIGTFLTAMGELWPKAVVLIQELIALIIKVLDENAPPFIAAGIRLLVSFLSGIANNIGKVTESVLLIIAGFLSELARNAPRIAASGASALAAWLKGIADNIGRVIAQAANLVVKFIQGIVKHLPKVYAEGTRLIVTYLNAVAKALPEVIRSGVRVILGFIKGIGNAIPDVIREGVRVIRKFIFGIAQALPDLADAGFKAVIKFLNGTARAIRENDDAMIDAGFNLADAIIDGMVKGFKELGHRAVDAAKDLALALPKKVIDVLGISSPSKVFQEIGKFTMLGFVKGLEDNSKPVKDSAEGIGRSVIDITKSIFGIRSPSQVMRDLGKEVGAGFAQGIHGSKDDIRNAFQSMNDRLVETIRSARQAIAEEQRNIKEQLKAEKPDLEAIRESQKVIRDNEIIMNRSAAARRRLVDGLHDEENMLVRLTGKWEKTTAKLDEARKVLEDARAARDSAQAALTDKFATTPVIDKDSDTMVMDYTVALRDQIAATKSYTETLAKLRALGLDDTTYQKLLDEGLAGKEFAESLLQGGKTAVDGINKLDTELLAASTTLATNAATALYQAGVDAARGLVQGLNSKKKELEDTMDFIADSLVRAIRRKLKIKSPSEAFSEIGIFVAEGLAKGIQTASRRATNAATQLGADTLSAIQTSVASISSEIAEGIDANPVITPVLDLSNVQQNAKKLTDLTNVTPITAAPSFQQAQAISTEHQQAQADQAEAAAVQQFNFEQNNYSPEKLSEIEIYRQTNNQLAQAKSALGLTP